MNAPCHISIFVRDLEESKRFYCDKLGFQLRRELPTSIHVDFWGNQIVLHESHDYQAEVFQRQVEGDEFVVPHFGVIVTRVQFEELVMRLRSLSIQFFGEPRNRFKGKAYEQYVAFIKDPSGNALEFKCFVNRQPKDWC